MKEISEKSKYYWSFGVFFLGFFSLLLCYPPTYWASFKCNRSTGVCTLETKNVLRTEKQSINIENINLARFDEAGFLTRGYQGPEISLKEGQNMLIGTSMTIHLPWEDRNTTNEINQFLENKDTKETSIKEWSTMAFFVPILLPFLGIYFVCKSLKPYFLESLKKE